MIPTVTRRRSIRLVVIVVVFAVFSPIVGATVSQVVYEPPSWILAPASPLGGFPPDRADREEMEAQDAGSAEPGVIDLGKSFVPGVVPPTAGAAIALVSFGVHSSPHLPKIFRPPIG